MPLKGRGILYYNNIWQESGFVIAKEKKFFGGYLSLEYVHDIKYKNEKPKLTWCHSLELAYIFTLASRSDKIQTKKDLEKMLKEYDLYGKAHVYFVEEVTKVKNKML